MSSHRLIGRVKWFNSKSGFGFITVCDGSHKDKDIFAHFTALRGDSNIHKHLVMGEYVEFMLSKSESEQHEFIATDISGIHGGLMMCDTQRLNNIRSSNHVNESRQFSDVKRRPRPVDR